MSSANRGFLGTQDRFRSVARRGAAGRHLHRAGTRQVRRDDRQIVLERERDERLVHRPAPARRALALRDEVIDVAGALAARAVDRALVLAVELLEGDRRSRAVHDELAQRRSAKRMLDARCRAPRPARQPAIRAWRRPAHPHSPAAAWPRARRRRRQRTARASQGLSSSHGRRRDEHDFPQRTAQDDRHLSAQGLGVPFRV